MDSSRFYSVLAALLFTAVCAWVGASLYSGFSAAEHRIPADAGADSGTLSGIVLRRERLFSPDSGQAPADGQRLSAGAAGESAVFFSACDGYEYLSPEDAQALTPERLDALMNGSAAAPSGSAKLVLGCDWYYAAFYDGTDMPEPGAYRLVFDFSGQPVRALLLSADTDSTGRTALLFRLTEGGDYLKLRFSDAVIVG